MASQSRTASHIAYSPGSLTNSTGFYCIIRLCISAAGSARVYMHPGPQQLKLRNPHKPQELNSIRGKLSENDLQHEAANVFLF